MPAADSLAALAFLRRSKPRPSRGTLASMERLADRFDWGPTIEAELCDGCRTCADFCHKGVFDERDGKVWVVGM